METSKQSDRSRSRNQVNFAISVDEDDSKIKNLRRATQRRLDEFDDIEERQRQSQIVGMSIGIVFASLIFTCWTLPLWICWGKLCCTYNYSFGSPKLRCKNFCKEPVCKYKRPLHDNENSHYRRAKKDGLVGEPNQDIMKFMKMQQQANNLNYMNQMAQSNQTYMNQGMGMGMFNQGMMMQGGMQLYQVNPTQMDMHHQNNMMMPTQQNHLMTDAQINNSHSVTNGMQSQDTTLMRNSNEYNQNTSVIEMNQQYPQSQLKPKVF
eukprot:403344597